VVVGLLRGFNFKTRAFSAKSIQNQGKGSYFGSKQRLAKHFWFGVSDINFEERFFLVKTLKIHFLCLLNVLHVE